VIDEVKKKLSRKEAREEIDELFCRQEFSSEDVKKVKRLAMKYKIKLKFERKKFCKRCLSKLRGKIRVSRVYKSVECEKCGFINKFRM
jgi:RNase P subunit RPR2